MKWFRNNGLSVVFLLLFIFTLGGQVFTGLKQYNQEMQEEGGIQVNLNGYLHSGHFVEATFENFESEFLQMALFVILSACLYQKGSSESKDPDGDNEVDKKPDPLKKDAPWPVRKGGFILKLYKNSLSIALIILFILSFIMHFYGSWKNFNHGQQLKGMAMESSGEYLFNSKFWFESFQNWQSEFLSILTILLLTIHLRQKGSAQSKPVDAAYGETGGGGNR